MERPTGEATAQALRQRPVEGEHPPQEPAPRQEERPSRPVEEAVPGREERRLGRDGEARPGEAEKLTLAAELEEVAMSLAVLALFLENLDGLLHRGGRELRAILGGRAGEELPRLAGAAGDDPVREAILRHYLRQNR